MSSSPMQIRPAVGSSRPATIRSVVVLPHPDGPSSAKNEPLRDGQGEVVDGDEVAEPLGHVVELQVHRISHR